MRDGITSDRTVGVRWPSLLHLYHHNPSAISADIKKNAEFRKHFQEMCATIGVDPLASSKGFWSEMLGVGDYYYELGERCCCVNI